MIKYAPYSKEAGINLKGLFLNADSGFDSTDVVAACEKEEIIAIGKEIRQLSQLGTRAL
ncbi:hypothetical protein [Spirosoma radiotolerans]|uniref:hypothetical protein n=1 Tax=Spirosoma radiotolerans TaxID=1379870 RepID=UPI000AD6DF50|nr:hypothetical protein [Spirosoma radiotolerans]